MDHGKCRFACYETNLCSAYQFQGSTNKCEMFQAPDHLKSASANAHWHRVAATLMKTHYEDDKSSFDAKELKALEAARNEVRPGVSKALAKQADTMLQSSVKLALHKAKMKRLAQIKGAKTKEQGMEAKKLGLYRVQQIKEFAAQKMSSFQTAINEKVKYSVHEQAKAELRKDEHMKQMEKSDFKHLDAELQHYQSIFHDDTKVQITRELNLQFVNDMDKFVDRRVGKFKQKMFSDEAAKLGKQIDTAVSKTKVEQKQAPKDAN